MDQYKKVIKTPQMNCLYKDICHNKYVGKAPIDDSYNDTSSIKEKLNEHRNPKFLHLLRDLILAALAIPSLGASVYLKDRQSIQVTGNRHTFFATETTSERIADGFVSNAMEIAPEEKSPRYGMAGG